MQAVNACVQGNFLWLFRNVNVKCEWQEKSNPLLTAY